MTREYAIRWLSKKLKVARQNAKDCETEWFATKSMYHTAVTVYEMAIAALREQEALEKKTSDSKTSDKKTSDWISVEERLPDEFVSVLVYMPDESPLPTVHEGFLAREGVWYANHFDREPMEITHWMPLPSAPEEDV